MTISPSVTSSNAGSYDCVVTDTLNGTSATSTSTAAVLTVLAAPSNNTVSVTVSGLNSSGLVLQLNGGNDLAITTNGTASFGTTLASGSSYAVTVGTQPAGEMCTVTSGTGTVSSGNITGPAVSCVSNSTRQYTVAVTVSGLPQREDHVMVVEALALVLGQDLGEAALD